MRNESIRGSLTTYTVWDMLSMFWSNDRVSAWYNALFPAGTDFCHNLICLSPNAHEFWGRAYFALQPIELSEDKKRLTIRFFWLQSHDKSSEVNILQRPSLSSDLDHGPKASKLWNHETDKKIRSGDEFSLETDDPVARPLPSFALLEMQWFLHRVAAISGAAEPQDEYGSDSDEDDDLPMAVQKGLDLDTEDLHLEMAPSLVMDRSSSTVPIPSSSPVHRIPVAPEDVIFKHVAATREEESTEMVAENIMDL